MLNLRIVRGPLEDRQNEAILAEYNRLTSSRIPMDEFVRWIQRGPMGPAWHAILETDDAQIVGHTSLIPLRTGHQEGRVTPAKSEYSFVCEEFRAAKIRGIEKSARPKFVILVDQLLRHCDSEGWGPFFISTTPALHRLGPRIGCHPADFPLRECILTLRPLRAAHHTPNLGFRQRAGLFAVGVLQKLAWSIVLAGFPRQKGIRSVPAGGGSLDADTDRLSFFEDSASLEWRYPEGQYARLAFENEHGDCVIVKVASENRYLRVCQWRLRAGVPSFALIVELARMAQAERALGVRWAVYGDDQQSAKFVGRMRTLGFLCARRVRTLLVYAKDPEFRASAKWNMADSLFSFDP